MFQNFLRTMLLVGALSFFSTINAQITLNLSDLSQYYTIGNIIIENFDTLENSAMYDIGTPGGGNTWDFRNAQLSVVSEQQMVISPADGMGNSNFPDANVALRFAFDDEEVQGSLFTYLRISSSGIDALGSYGSTSAEGSSITSTTINTPAQPALTLPLTFGDSWTHEGIELFKSTFDGTPLPDSEDDVSSSNSVDAYGTLIFPNGESQQALRIRQVDVSSTEFIPGFPTTDTSLTFLFIAANGDILSVGADDFNAPNQGMIAGSLQWNVSSDITATEDLEAIGFQLPEVAPNPLSQATMIAYTLPEAEQVRLSLFDINGRLAKQLVNSRQASGTHSINLEVNDLAPGQYYLSLIVRGGVITRKVNVVR